MHIERADADAAQVNPASTAERNVVNYNVVDLAILILLAYFVFLGIRRGFLAGAADLAIMGLGFYFAIRAYPIAGNWLAHVVELPRALINLIALMGLFIVGELLFGALASPLLTLAYRYLLRGPLRLLDAIAGVAPGLVKGLLIAAALVTFLALFPLKPMVREEIQSSPLGNRLAEAVGSAAPRMETLLGGSAHDTALFITQPAGEEAPRQMNFPAGLSTRYDQGDELVMLSLVNQARADAGLAPLTLDARLSTAARAHSEDMFRQRYFAHDSPDGKSPADRLAADGIPFVTMGENLAYAPSVEVAHTGLMNSAGHRRNILSPQFGRIGIGIVDGGLYGKMFSQEFTN